MKLLTCVIASLFFSTSIYAAQALDIALESQSIRVEYIESSKSGNIYVKGCGQCEKSFYSFDKEPKIFKQGKEIDFKKFMTDYWNAQWPTLFLDMKSQSVLRVHY